MIDEFAGMDVRFDSYPLDSDFLPKRRAAIIEKIKEYILKIQAVVVLHDGLLLFAIKYRRVNSRR